MGHQSKWWPREGHPWEPFCFGCRRGRRRRGGWKIANWDGLTPPLFLHKVNLVISLIIVCSTSSSLLSSSPSTTWALNNQKLEPHAAQQDRWSHSASTWTPSWQWTWKYKIQILADADITRICFMSASSSHLLVVILILLLRQVVSSESPAKQRQCQIVVQIDSQPYILMEFMGKTSELSYQTQIFLLISKMFGIFSVRP